jgi:iron complex outermembrane receptor protein
MKMSIRKNMIGAWLLCSSASAFAQQVPQVPAPSGASAGTAEAVSGTPTDGQEPSPGAQTDSGGVGDIIVTAQRRAERLQEVPIAVTALSATSLANANVRSLQDLSASIPGFVATGSAGYGGAPLSIRGVGGSNGGGNFFADEPVATYVDGVYVGRLSVSTSDVVDLDSIQVLRGPQGTLYGRNSTAGAVLIGTARPTRDLTARAEATINSLGNWRAEGAVSGPLVGEKVLARIAAAYNRRDGYGVNVVTGKQVGRGRDITLRGSLRLLPAEGMTIDLIGEHFNQHSQPAQIRIASITGGTADSPFVPRADLTAVMKDNRYAFDERTYNHIRTDAATVLIQYEGNGPTFNSVTGYRTFKVDGQADADNTAPAEQTGGPLRAYNAAQLRNSQFTQEFRLSSPSGNGRLSWTGGIFYIHEDNNVDQFRIYNASAYFGLGTNAVFAAHQKLDSVASFADLSFEVIDGLTLRAGGRYSYEKKSFDVTQRVNTLLGGFSPAVGRVVPAGFVIAAPPTFNALADFNKVSARFVVDYKVTRDILAYASYSQGFKSGGFNAFGLSPAFRPETIDSYEAGIKTELFDRMLRFNLDGFTYNYDNLQVRVPVPTGGVSIQNAASARVKGIELESALVPMRGLRFSLTGAYLDAHFISGTLTQVPEVARFRLGAAAPLQTVSIAGNRLSRAPKWQMAATAEYETALGDMLKLTGGANFRYQTNSFFLETNQNTDTFRSGAWSELGLRVTLAAVDEAWSLTAFGDNVLDDRHFTQIAALNAFPFGTLNEPRRFGLRGTAKF